MPNTVYLVPENSRLIDDVGRGMGSDVRLGKGTGRWAGFIVSCL